MSETRRLTPEQLLEALPPVAFGTGGNICGYPEPADRAKAVALLSAAIADAKSRDEYLWIDSALHYGAGFSLRCIGEALGAEPYSKVILSFKVGRVLVDKGSAGAEASPFRLEETHDRRFDYSAAGVRRAFDQSFEQLNAARPEAWKRIAPGDLPTIVFVHDPERGVHGDKWEEVVRQVKDEGLTALDALKREGKIQLVGIGTNEVEAARRFVRDPQVDLLMTAGRFTLLAHGAKAAPAAVQRDTTHTPDLIREAKEASKTLICASPYNSGLMADRPESPTASYYNYTNAAPEVAAYAAQIKAACRAHRVSPETAAMQFPLLAGARAVVCGPSTMDEFRCSRDAAMHPVNPRLWQDLAMAGQMYPAFLYAPEVVARKGAVR